MSFKIKFFIRGIDMETMMSKAETETLNLSTEEKNQFSMDSKYRLIIVAAKRSKQLQRGARPRIDIDSQKHKFTRIAIEEVEQGKVNFEITEQA